MSPELIGFLSAFGAMAITVFAFWLKTVIPQWWRNRQAQDNKKLDVDLEIKRNSFTEEIKKDGALYTAYLDSVKLMPGLIEAVKNLTLNVDRGFANLGGQHSTSFNSLNTAIMELKEHFDERLEHHAHKIIIEIKDQKFHQLESKIEQIAPPSRTSLT